MKERIHKRIGERRESGAALLIAIFALLLISVVAIAMIVTQGTDSALAGNYRTSTSAYYAAVAGLEEARGRLLWKNKDCLVSRPNSPPNPNCPNPTFIPTAGTQPAMGLTDVRYILNPASGETVDPTSASPANYPDTEYGTEMGWPLSGANVQTTTSIFPVAGLPGPSYKWVRINPVTEYALQLDVDGNSVIDRTTALLYDPSNMDGFNNPRPGLKFPTIPPTQTAVQALEITALAVMPNGSKRMLQYLVAPLVISSLLSNPPHGIPPNMNFPAALTLDGQNVMFTGPGTTGMNGYYIHGLDQCSATNFMVPPIGYTDSGGGDTSRANVLAGATPLANYDGYPPLFGPPPQAPSTGAAAIQDVSITMEQNWRSPAGLDGIVQDITKGADIVFNGSTTAASLTALGMSATNPMTVVVNGDLDLNGWHNVGYGLLLVTGTLKYDPDATWEGLVLVIGQGAFVATKSGNGGIDGAVLIAKTRDTSGNLLPVLGVASYSQTGGGTSLGRGINYNSCLVNSAGAQAPLSYKVLSFREIPTN